MEPFIDFYVDSTPETKGSWRALAKGRVKADNPREKAWAQRVAIIAKLKMRGRIPKTGAIRVQVEFFLPTPKGKKNRRDLDKLLRSLLDAMQVAGVYLDDEQVIEIHTRKYISDAAPGAMVRVFV